MADLLKVLELKNQLAMLIAELDSYAVAPSSQDFEDKTVSAKIYDYPANTGVFSESSGRKMYVKDGNAIELKGYYFNAIQELGAFVTTNMPTRETDYIILSKNPEETASPLMLEFFVWGKYESQGGNFFDWKRKFQSNKEDYAVDLHEFYVKDYTEKLAAIKKASDGRTKKKKDPLPPVHVLWEDQMYDFLLDQNAFDKDIIKCKLKQKQADGKDFIMAVQRLEPFIDKGKSVEFSISMKNGTPEDVNSALDKMTAFKNNVSEIAIIESEPKVDGKNVTMLVRSNKSDKEALLKDYIEESDSDKLDRAVKMFAASVEMVERSLDLTNDYNTPIVKYGTFKGERVVGPEKYNKVTEFLNALIGWMGSHDMKYDYDSKPEEIADCIKMYFDQAVSSNRGWADIDGLVGVRIPIGIIVAYLNYASPFSDIQFEFAHDKWEYRGDYSTGKLVAVRFKRFDEMPEIDYCYYEERDM